MREIWEAAEDDGDRAVTDWSIDKRAEAKLDQKLHMLQSAEVDQAGRCNLPQNLLAGPGVYGKKWIYKLKVHGNVQLRPMVCLGPSDKAQEWTVLARAIEISRKLVPADAPAQAEERRQEISNGSRTRFLLLEKKP